MNTSNLFTEKEAREKRCPFSLNNSNGIHRCNGSDCMAWKWVENQVKREDHSNAMDMMLKLKVERNNPEIRREGPPGSSGILILDARGKCGRIS